MDPECKYRLARPPPAQYKTTPQHIAKYKQKHNTKYKKYWTQNSIIGRLFALYPIFPLHEYRTNIAKSLNLKV